VIAIIFSLQPNIFQIASWELPWQPENHHYSLFYSCHPVISELYCVLWLIAFCMVQVIYIPKL